MSSISTAELAIYALFSIAVLYILVKHGRPGFLGWFYLFIFCTIRIVGGVLEIKKSSSASVVANIGLSPLLLATSGILHEGYVLFFANSIMFSTLKKKTLTSGQYSDIMYYCIGKRTVYQRQIEKPKSFY